MMLIIMMLIIDQKEGVKLTGKMLLISNSTWVQMGFDWIGWTARVSQRMSQRMCQYDWRISQRMSESYWRKYILSGYLSVQVCESGLNRKESQGIKCQPDAKDDIIDHRV